MIVLTALCERDHEFEGWYRSRDDFETQAASSLIACPDCGSTRVRKGLSSPHVARRAETPEAERPVALCNEVAARRAFLAAMRDHVLTHFEDLGPGFAEEARRIHEGRSPRRGIYGEATKAQVEDLLEEGVPVAPLPAPPESAN